MTIRNLRIASQLLFFSFFLYLFWITSEVSGRLIPVDLYLKADPLIALSVMLGARVFIPGLLISLVVIITTLLLGRVFCGWVCPMGTTLDFTSRIAHSPVRYKIHKTHHFKYYLLIGFILSALLGSQLVYHLDPIALITRVFTVTLLPAVVNVFNFLFNLLFSIKPLQIPLLHLQSSLIDTLLPIEPYYFQTGLTIGLIFVVIIGFEIYSRRTFCQTICPLGALLGLLSKPQLLRRYVNDDCAHCGSCQDVCKTSAIPFEYNETTMRECIQCYSCIDICPENAISINFNNKARKHTTDLSRRRIIVSGTGGIAAAALTGISHIHPPAQSKLIRPPGSVPEDEYVERCIRCYQCLRACATSGNFLQPSLLEGGWQGLLTPYGVAATGYCEFNCTLCTEVCPTDAIKVLDEATKHTTIIGLAHFDKSRCLPYKNGTPCIVCEEHCPTPDKAIKFREEEYKYPDGTANIIQMPYVVEDLCIGCGICEYMCPVEGDAGIYMTNQTERTTADSGGNYS
ncbi:MAG: 4Fe-4S binding protein [candidate division Zixibacteria bacterium]|nr:4Fe-4S binding protein [candidate division Zixibacteria bacterium]